MSFIEFLDWSDKLIKKVSFLTLSARDKTMIKLLIEEKKAELIQNRL